MGEAAITKTSEAAAGTVEHYLTRVLAGEPESAPARLADALEALGYHILGDAPIEARRGARGLAARIHTSNNVLDYPVALNVAVKSASAGSARVTFYYRLKHPLLSASGRATLTREAEAVVALAALRAGRARCVACGSLAAAGSRFCRQCGAPSGRDEPSEFEVLRVTAGTCASFQLTTIGALLFLCATLATVAAWADWLGRGRVFAWVATALGVGAGIGLFAGLRRMYRTLHPSLDDAEHAPESGLMTGALSATRDLQPVVRARAVQGSLREQTTRHLRTPEEEDSAKTQELAEE